MKQVNYNEVSRIYDDVREADIVLIEHFLSELPEEDGLNVLDLGCGTGNFTDLFQGLVQGRACRLYGIDPSEGMIARAQSKNDQVFFRQGTAENIPLEDDFCSFVFMTDVIHHVPDIRVMFREMYRVLRHQGKVCIVTQSHRQIAARPIAQLFPGTVAVDRARYPDIPQIAEAARAGGLAALKEEILFAGEAMELGEGFLELVRKKGYSMLHLLAEKEYQQGLAALEKALQNGPIQARQAGETLVWFAKE